MAQHEIERGGYEYPSRRFIDAHLMPGDVFIDVGAHWGMYSLHAASLHPGAVRVLAIEPHPDNARNLLRIVAENALTDSIEVITVAAGASAATAPLMINSTMAHSLFGLGLPTGAPRLGQISVPVLPLDLLIAERSDLDGRPVILKIDVEGFEPEVIEGAARLLDSDRLKAVIWEHGSAFVGDGRPEKLTALEIALTRRGFRQFRFPHPTMGGPLIRYADTPEVYNVFALAPDVTPLACYDKPSRRPEPLPPLERPPRDPQVRAAVTRRLIECKATDGARWADFEAMREGADERAGQIAKYIPRRSRVLDIGAGVMALGQRLPGDCDYVPVDLLPWDERTLVIDLNQQPFPEAESDIVVMLDVLEFLHDPAASLRGAAACASRMIISYRPGGSEQERRENGFFNDLGAEHVIDMIASTGWRITTRDDAPDRLIVDCRRG